MGIWVDTDFGFDDLWALLLLRHSGVSVDCVSLVAGNATLDQVCRNAFGAKQVFGFDWPLTKGAARPIKRRQETAQSILGPLAMQSRGRHLPQDSAQTFTGPALAQWLQDDADRQVLALGPLTNLAMLCRDDPAAAQRISGVTWMGGSIGRGNHSEYAEFNAIADAEALDILLQAQVPLRVVELELCRGVTFGEQYVHDLGGNSGGMLTELLGGYLDIALSRGRQGMAVYDPLAALALARPELFTFRPARASVCTQSLPQYGQTIFDFQAQPNVEVATELDVAAVMSQCMGALKTQAECVSHA